MEPKELTEMKKDKQKCVIRRVIIYDPQSLPIISSSYPIIPAAERTSVHGIVTETA